MKTLSMMCILCVACWATSCGASAPSDAKGDGGGEKAPAEKEKTAPKAEMTLEQYLDLKTDALPADKIDWRKAMEIARKRLMDAPDAKAYNAFMPVQWFNAEHDVYIFTYRRNDDRTIAKDAPTRGFAVILNASTGAVVAAGAYQR